MASSIVERLLAKEGQDPLLGLTSEVRLGRDELQKAIQQRADALRKKYLQRNLPALKKCCFQQLSKDFNSINTWLLSPKPLIAQATNAMGFAAEPSVVRFLLTTRLTPMCVAMSRKFSVRLRSSWTGESSRSILWLHSASR